LEQLKAAALLDEAFVMHRRLATGAGLLAQSEPMRSGQCRAPPPAFCLPTTSGLRARKIDRHGNGQEDGGKNNGEKSPPAPRFDRRRAAPAGSAR
jgi:hypothetical protein